jgi:hypothetical protein
VYIAAPHEKQWMSRAGLVHDSSMAVILALAVLVTLIAEAIWCLAFFLAA